MVRIAETPEEWERIHRVLSLIGREKDSYEAIKNYPKSYIEHEIKDVKNLTENSSIPSFQNKSLYKTTDVADIGPKTSTSSTTLSPLANTPILVKEIDNLDLESENLDEMDTGWPDFEEAIVKKVKKVHSIDENDILETNWLEDDWLHTKWNDVLSGGGNEPSASQFSKSAPTPNPKSSVTNGKTSLGDDVPRSRLYRDPKILEFRLKDVIAFQNHTIEQNTSEEANASSSRSDRPMFVYHRVTTSPQERRGNSAFIAVSVVRQSPAESPPATTLPPLRRTQFQKDSSLSNHQKKHPHWRQHNRGRRHRRTQSHAHTHH